MSPDFFALAMINSQRAMKEMVEGAGPGSTREAAPDEAAQPASSRVALARRFFGRTMIRAGERLRGATAQPDTAYSA
jgi:hypothetical protein